MMRAMQPLDTFDDNAAIRFHRNDRAHLLQKFYQLDDLGLDGSIINDRRTFGECSGDQDIFCCANARKFQLDVLTME